MKRVISGLGLAVVLLSAVFLSLKKTPPPVLSEQTDDLIQEQPDNLRLTETTFDKLDGFETDQIKQALLALKRSCAVLEKRYARWREFCKKLNQKTFTADDELRSFIKKEMLVFAVNNSETGLFTGYYEPEIEGSLVKTKEYTVPVYALPQDIVRIDLGKFNPKFKGEILFGKQDGKEIKPYLTRREIETGKVNFPAKIIAWVKEPAELFILQIQGSGTLKLPDGKKIGIGYAGNNGHAFTGIGSVMAQRGLLKDGVYTMAEIKNWLIANPQQAQSLMHENPRYIFFKKTDRPGAVGSLGVPLTAGRSLAVDPAYVPLGSFLWLQTTAPDGSALNRLVTAQDTGSAIKGAVRGDFFWGTGDKALKEAGRMKSRGVYFLLLPKSK